MLTLCCFKSKMLLERNERGIYMNKQKTMVFFQKLSRAFLMPIALLSVASLFMGVASIFLWHDQLRAMFPILTNPVIQHIAKLMDASAGVVMSNLPVLYAVSIGFSLADEDKEYAAFGSLVGYLAFIIGMGFLLTSNPNIMAMFPAKTITTILGYQTVNTGIVGAIAVGIISAYIHNHTHTIKLPMALAFFGGNRFVPIATSVSFMLLGQVFPFAWVYIAEAINWVASGVANSGIFGPFLYGFGERLLIPTGLHQIWNTVIRDTAVSGVFQFPAPYGLIEGARPAFNAFMSTNIVPAGTTLVDMVKFLRGGQMPQTMFMLPAAAFAIYKTAKPENRKNIKGLLITAVFTSLVAGITEPLEFMFLFIAPALYFVYSILVGACYLIPYLLGSTVGGTEGNILGFVLFGLLRPDANWWIILLTGVIMAVAGYLLFRWWIVKFDVKTPGRGGDYDDSMILAASIVDSNFKTDDPLVLKAQLIVKGLGGVDNIKSVDSCMSRLRVTLVSIDNIDEKILKATGCSGIVKAENDIQIIYGTTVNIIKNAVNKEIKSIKAA